MVIFLNLLTFLSEKCKNLLLPPVFYCVKGTYSTCACIAIKRNTVKPAYYF